jgi:hypothetical protein
MIELDDIRREQRRQAKGKPRPRTKRVNLTCQNVDLPTTVVFPCMVDPDWYEAHISGTLLEDDLELYKEDPEGFRDNDLLGDDEPPPEGHLTSTAS